MQKKQATKLEQLKHLKASQERAKTRRGSEATKGFQASKGTKTPKARPWYIICLPTSNTYQRSPLLNNERDISTIHHFHFQAFQLCGISTSRHLDDQLSGENIFIAQ